MGGGGGGVNTLPHLNKTKMLVFFIRIQSTSSFVCVNIYTLVTLNIRSTYLNNNRIRDPLRLMHSKHRRCCWCCCCSCFIHLSFFFFFFKQNRPKKKKKKNQNPKNPQKNQTNKTIKTTTTIKNNKTIHK